MTATLNSFITKADKVKIYLAVCKKKGIEVLPPDVNLSREKFTVDGNSIRFGLRGLKNMGATSKLVIAERDERGLFEDFQDFVERMSKYQKIDKSALESLVFSGAVDNFEGTRSAKISMIGTLTEVGKKIKKNANSGQISLFDTDVISSFDEDTQEMLSEVKKIDIPVVDEFNKRYKLEKEKEFAGFYVTEHPLDDYAKYFSEEGIYEVGFLMPEEVDGTEEEEANYSYDGEYVKIAGIVTEVKTFFTKKNEAMNVFTIEDRTGEMKCVAFPKDREKNIDKIIEGKIVIVNGMMKVDDRGTQLIVKTMVDVDALKMSEIPEVLWLQGANNKLWARKQWAEVQQIVSKNPGDVVVNFNFDGKKYQMKSKLKLTLGVMVSLQAIMGESNIQVMYKR